MMDSFQLFTEEESAYLLVVALVVAFILGA